MSLTRFASAAICVPVRNEQQALPALLAALAALARQERGAVVCFFLDGCSDDSEGVIRAASTGFPFAVEIERSTTAGAPNAGVARAAAMAMARGADNLLTTDADSRPRPGWLAAARRALSIADVAAGRLVRVPGSSPGQADPIQSRVEAYYDRLHGLRRAIDPVAWDCGAGFHFSGGANLAIRASAYRALGGFAPLASGEDADLLDRAARAGFRVRRDPAMVVETSSRRDGRAPGGLAAALRAIDAGGPPMVPHPAAAAWQYRAQAQARSAYADIAHEPMRRRLGAAIGLSGDHVLGVARDCPNAEAFAMRVVPAAPGGERLVTLAEAEAALGVLERSLCARAA